MTGMKPMLRVAASVVLLAVSLAASRAAAEPCGLCRYAEPTPPPITEPKK